MGAQHVNSIIDQYTTDVENCNIDYKRTTHPILKIVDNHSSQLALNC